MRKLLVITGPTATGKTALGVELAQKFNGEIISADSRQVYKFMDIATGKDTTHFQWGINLVNPDQQFNVSQWVNYTIRVIREIWGRGKLPIIVGGTGLYIKELLHPSETLHVPQNRELRIMNYELCELQNKLQKTDSAKWESMNNSDRNNPRRLIRAIEVAGIRDSGPGQNDGWNVLIIGLTAPLEELYKRIDKRVEERVKVGVQKEKEKLLKMGYQPKGFGYIENSIDEWKTNEHQYAKRQLTYLKKYLPQTHWFEINSPEIHDSVGRWYSDSNDS